MTHPLVSSCVVLVAVLLFILSVGGTWDGVTSRYVASLKPLLESLSFDQARISVWLRWWGIALCCTFVVFTFVFMMPPVAFAAVYLVYVAPKIILEILIQRRRILLRDQMVTATVALSNTCRAGLSLAQGLEVISAEVPQPLSTELQRIVTGYHHGRPLAESIRECKQRLNVDSFSLFAVAVLVSLERGGRITNALERISHSLQETQRVERKLEVDTASGRKVVWLLTGFPFLFLAFSYFSNPSGTTMVFQSILGQVVLLVVIGLSYGSFRWSQKILDIEI